MTAHHQGGIDMATEAAEHCRQRRCPPTSRAWARNQQSEIVELEALLDDGSAG